MSTGRDERVVATPQAEALASPRRRRYLPTAVIALLRPLFRYSEFRDAYVLRGVGHTRGPVLRARRRAGH